MSETRTILKADKAARRRGLIMAVAGLAAGVITLRACQMSLARTAVLSRTDPQLALHRVEMVFSLLVSGLALSVLGFAIWLIATARRTLLTGQYPPPGMKVVSDTRLLVGDAARRRATAGIILAGILIALTVCLLLWGWRSLGRF